MCMDNQNIHKKQKGNVKTLTPLPTSILVYPRAESVDIAVLLAYTSSISLT